MMEKKTTPFIGIFRKLHIFFLLVLLFCCNLLGNRAYAEFQNAFDKVGGQIENLGQGITGADTALESNPLDQTKKDTDAMFKKAQQDLDAIKQETFMQSNCDPKIGVWDEKRNQCLPKAVFDAGNEGLCKSEGITATNASGQVYCKQKLQSGPCELFELAIRAAEREKQGNVEGSSYTCQEFIDPVPASAVKNTQNALCITMLRGYTAESSAFTNTSTSAIGLPFLDIQPATDDSKYCHAIALKTTSDFGIVFSLVGYLFFIVQPLLIAAGVGMIIYCGVEIMYGGGGTSEEAIKKVYKQLQQVLMGLALLFLIKLFLTTVNGLFFVQ